MFKADVLTSDKKSREQIGNKLWSQSFALAMKDFLDEMKIKINPLISVPQGVAFRKSILVFYSRLTDNDHLLTCCEDIHNACLEKLLQSREAFEDAESITFVEHRFPPDASVHFSRVTDNNGIQVDFIKQFDLYSMTTKCDLVAHFILNRQILDRRE